MCNSRSPFFNDKSQARVQGLASLKPSREFEPTNFVTRRRCTLESFSTLWWTNIAMENHNLLWENPLFLWPFSIAMLVHQRVTGLFSTSMTPSPKPKTVRRPGWPRVPSRNPARRRAWRRCSERVCRWGATRIRPGIARKIGDVNGNFIMNR